MLLTLIKELPVILIQKLNDKENPLKSWEGTVKTTEKLSGTYYIKLKKKTTRIKHIIHTFSSHNDPWLT